MAVEYVSHVPTAAEWLPIAIGELGVTEQEGAARNNERIVAYHATTTLRATQDEVAWCSAFVNWVMVTCGYRGTNSAAARSWLGYGVAEKDPRVGAIAIFDRADVANRNAAHVAFVLGWSTTELYVLGGNQDNQVKVKAYPKTRLIGMRWPNSLKPFFP